MSTLLHWFTSPEWAQVVKALLHSLWQGALIALLLAFVLRRLSNPVARYRTSLAALVSIVLCTIITWAIINSASQQPASSAPEPPMVAQPSATDFSATPESPDRPKSIALISHQSAAGRWTAWLAFAWLAGAMLMFARAGIKVAGAEQLRRSCRPLDNAHIESLLAETRRALGIARRIRVGVTDKLTSPAVVGVVVPMLILPLALLTTLTPGQIRFVLLHELAHIRRRDYLANLFQFFAESLLFFNPAVWWISHQIRREREACCDALATELSGAPADYAQTLVHVAETILYPPPAAAAAFGDKREPSSLAERIQRLLVPGYRPSLRLTWRAMLAALVFGGVLLFLSAIGTRLTVAAILTPQQRIDVIEKKMAEYGQTSEGASQVVQAPLTLIGHVRTSDGSPLPGKMQGTFYEKSGNASTVGRLDIKKDGTISNTISPGEIWVAAYADGFAPAVVGPFDASDTNRLDVGELVLNRGFDVTIRLTDAGSSAVLPNAALHTQFWVRGAGSTVQEPEDLKTDSNGEATLHHCANQPLAIAVNAPDREIIDQRFENVHPGETLDLKLKSGAQIAGIVTDQATGWPIAGATVRIIYQRGPVRSHYEWNDPIRFLATTGDDGRFMANQLQPGTIYWLGVSAPEHQSIILSNLVTGMRDVIARLGPELVVRGQVLGDVKGLQQIDNHYALYRSWSEVFDNGSWGNGASVPLENVNGVMRFEFTNRTAGPAQLVDEKGRTFERQVDTPVDNWVIDLNRFQTTAAVSNAPKREVIFRFKDPSGTRLTRGTVSVQVPDNLEPGHLTAHLEDKEITNGEVHVQIPLGGTTSVLPKQMIGYWIDNGYVPIEVTNGPGPLVVQVPVIPAGAIYAKARNADGTPAGGLFFGVDELKRAPGRNDYTPLNGNSDGVSDNLPRKWVSPPLPLGGTYRISGWRDYSFCVSKPVTLNGENPVAEVELQFPPGKTFEGVLLDGNGQPIANASLQPSFNLANSHGFSWSPIFTDEDGHFRMTNLTPGLGDYMIDADVPGMTAEHVKLDFNKQPQTIRLERGRRIAGYLVESNTSNILPGAQIRAVVLGNEKLASLSTQTDADGHFEFTQAGKGDYTFFLDCGVPASQQTYRGNVDTNITLAVKLYPWSTVKPAPRASASVTNEGTIEDAAGTNTLESVKEIHEEQIQNAQLVQDGKLMFQLGKLDEAEAKLNEALSRDPDNQAALYYLSIIKKYRFRNEADTRDIYSKQAQIDVEKDWRDSDARDSLPKPNLYARSNIIYASPERQTVYQKLNDITFADKISFPNMPLGEVLRILREETERRDPDKEGINFVISKVKPPSPAMPAFNPTMGQPIAAVAPANGTDLEDVQISLDPGIKNVSLVDVLEAIVKTADHPIKYSILDYGIEFSFRGPAQPEMFTRTFKVDPNTFYMGLQNVGSINFGTTSQSGGGGSGNAGNGNSSTSIPHVNAAGGGAGAGANRGLRYVTSVDPTTTIQTAVINFFNSVGVTLSPPKSIFYNDRQGTLTVHATADDLDLIEAAVDTLNVSPLGVTVKARFVEVPPDSNWPKKFEWYQTALATNLNPVVMALLTAPAFKDVLNALDRRDGADLINEGQVTTLSGRQANFQVVGVESFADSNSGTQNAGQSTNLDVTADPFGTTLDVVPTVFADGSTIQMVLIPTITEFLGTNQSDTTTIVAGGVPITSLGLLLPHARVRQITLSSSLKDGQTVVLGGFPGKSNGITNLLIFITPTITNASDYRIHPEYHVDGPGHRRGIGDGGFGGGGFGGGQ